MISSRKFNLHRDLITMEIFSLMNSYFCSFVFTLSCIFVKFHCKNSFTNFSNFHFNRCTSNSLNKMKKKVSTVRSTVDLQTRYILWKIFPNFLLIPKFSNDFLISSLKILQKIKRILQKIYFRSRATTQQNNTID